MINLLETVYIKTQKELEYNTQGTALKAIFLCTFNEDVHVKIFHSKKEGYLLQITLWNEKEDRCSIIHEDKNKKYRALVSSFRYDFDPGGCNWGKFASFINDAIKLEKQDRDQDQDQFELAAYDKKTWSYIDTRALKSWSLDMLKNEGISFECTDEGTLFEGDSRDALIQAKQEGFEGTQEDFKEDYMSLEIAIEEEPLNYSLSNQTYKILESKKGLDDDLLEEIQGLDICSKYDDQTYITTFHKKQCTNYKIRYVLKLSRSLYTTEQDHFNNEFSLKG